ncbi:MAG: beta strand repeat-containing protein, partial [Planctomycetia bacterium]
MGSARRIRSQRGKRAAARRRAERRWLGLEPLEDKRLLAVTVNFDAATGDLLFFDDNTGSATNTVSLFMRDAVGSSLFYSVNGAPLTPTPAPLGTGPQTGVTSVRFIDSAPSGPAGDKLEVYGFGAGSFTVSGKNLVFGGALPITTLNVEEIVLDGMESRAAVTLDGVGVLGDVTIRNASVTTIAGTSAYQIGGDLSIDTNTLQLNGALSVTGTTSFTVSGGISQSADSPITTKSLTVVNSISGDILLTNSFNAVDTVAITNLAEGGNVSYTDSDSVTLGVSGVGIVANNAAVVNVTSGGVLQLNADIKAGDGTVLLSAANGITQSGAIGVIGQSLTVVNGTGLTPSGDISLVGTLNNVDAIAGVNNASAGSIAFVNSTGLAIGAGAGGVNGLTTTSGRISVTATAGPLAIQQAVTAGNGGEIVLSANLGITQSGAGVVLARQLSLSNLTQGLIDLNLPGNDVEFLVAANSTPDGTIRYQDANGFAIGVGGIATTGNSGAVSLISQGSITQLGSIVTRTLSLDNQSAASGDLLLPLTTNDVAFLNAANAYAGGTIRYTDASAFNVGTDGINAAGNNVFLAAVGALAQDGDIVAGSLDIQQTGSGSVDFTRATNSIATLTGGIGTGTMAVTTQTPLSIGTAGISASAATVSLTTAGSLTQTGAVSAQLLNAVNMSALAGDVVLDNTANAIATFTASNAFGTGLVTLVNSTTTVIGAAGIIADGNDVSLTVNGGLSQSGRVIATAFTVSNTSTTAGAITLDLATNDVTSFGATNAAVGAGTTYRDASGFDVTGVSGQGSVTLSSVGDLTQSGAITTPGLLTASNLSGTTGSVVLANTGNRVTSLAGGNANADATKLPVFKYTDADDLVIGAAGITAAVSDVTLAATGNLTQDATSGAIRSRSLDVSNSSTTRGLVTLTNAKNDTALFSATNLFGKGSVSYTDLNSVTLGAGGIAADKNAVTLNVSGNILQNVASGAITARSLVLNNANASLGQIALANANNDVDLLAIANAAVTATSTYTDSDGLTIDTAGINAAAGAGNVVLNAGGTLDQLGVITAREFTANTTAGNILLTTATNDVKLFNASNTNATGTVSYTDANDVGIGTAGIAGNTVNLTFATALSQDVTIGGAIVAGTLNLASTKAAANTSLVTLANNVGTLTASYTGSGGSLTYVDADGLAIGQLTSSTVGIQATGAAVSLSVGGAGTLSQTGTVQAASLTVASVTGSVDLSLAGNDVASLTGSSTSGNIKYRDASALNVGAAGLVTAGNVDLTTVGDLTQSGKIVATAFTVSNTSTTAGAITLDLATNDVTSFGATNAAVGAGTTYR